MHSSDVLNEIFGVVTVGKPLVLPIPPSSAKHAEPIAQGRITLEPISNRDLDRTVGAKEITG
jgi:hypothetical protein